MKNYLLIAEVLLKDAEKNKSLWRDDDVYINISCRNLADGVEACIRYVMEMSSMANKRGHNLHDLVAYISPQINSYAWYNGLCIAVDNMGDWHTGLMYVKDFHGSASLAEKVIMLLEQIISDLKSFRPVEIKDISGRDLIQSVLDRNRTKLSVDDIEDLLPRAYLKRTDGISLEDLNDLVMYAVKTYHNRLKTKE